MRILVLIKQVPVVWAMKIDPATKTLKREGSPTEVSSFDVRALAKGVELARQHGGEVVAVTMGPPQAAKALETCLAMGADRGLHLCDRAFAASDTLATARALAAACSREGFDLILCGRHSVDAETGQVGPEVAELLGIAQVTGARRLEIDAATNRVTIERDTDSGVEVLEGSLPLLVSAAEDLAEEPAPSKEDRELAKQKSVATIDAATLGIDPSQIGSEGSPTWVVGLETLESKRLGQVIAADSLEASVDQLVATLVGRGLFGAWTGHKHEARAVKTAAVKRAGSKDVWVVAEILDGKVREVTYELLGKGRELADRLGASLDAVLICGGAAGESSSGGAAGESSSGGAAGESSSAGTAGPTDGWVNDLSRYGADRVLLAEGVGLEDYDTDRCAAVLANAIGTRQPGMVILAATSIGRDLAPRVAARLGLGLTGDCLDLDLDAEGRLLQVKPAFGGSIVAPILSRTTPEMATVRAGILDVPAPDDNRSALVERLPIPLFETPRLRCVARRANAVAAAELDEAEFVIGVGKGLGARENIGALEPLAKILGAAICATRDVADDGWLPRQFQVGFTGKSIAPRLYIAIGIRGAVYHVIGVRRAEVVVAINKDSKAGIFKSADYGIVGDYEQVVPLLVERLARARAAAER